MTEKELRVREIRRRIGLVRQTVERGDPASLSDALDQLEQTLSQLLQLTSGIADQWGGKTKLLSDVPEEASALIQRDSSHPKVRLAVAMIRRKYWHERLRLTDVAHEVECSPFHLDRLLKLETGLTFSQHRLAIRMDRSRLMLMSGRFSVKEVAAACGFSGTSTFGRAFKRVHGSAPKAWSMLQTISTGVEPTGGPEEAETAIPEAVRNGFSVNPALKNDVKAAKEKARDSAQK
jgi:AraC-like DNA-binding protein